LQILYSELEEASDIEFLQRENQQSFIITSSKSKRDKYTINSLEYKRVNSLQEIMGQLQEMVNFEKKKIIHSNSVCLPSKDTSGLHGSPSLKKQGK
jgi:homoserine trans-succinylase